MINNIRYINVGIYILICDFKIIIGILNNNFVVIIFVEVINIVVMIGLLKDVNLFNIVVKNLLICIFIIMFGDSVKIVGV